MGMNQHCHVHRFRAMGSPCALHLYIEDSSQIESITAAVLTEVFRLEQKYSRYRDNSVASQINRVARQGGEFKVDAETAGLLDYADTTWRESDGLFDITSGVLRYAWDFKNAVVPTVAQVSDTLTRVGWQKIRWQNPIIAFEQKAMELDFGGYVKEYAADCAVAKAISLGVSHGLVELGGDIRVIGCHPDGRPWSVGVKHPRHEGRVLTKLTLKQGAVASSGDYERCIVHNGKRYGHILDPRTGWPVEGLIAVTVLADHCLLAGTACTVALLKGKDGLEWLQELGLPWVAMDASGQCHSGNTSMADQSFQALDA